MEVRKEPAVLLSSADAAPAKERYQYKHLRNASHNIRLLEITTQTTANPKTRSRCSSRSTLCSKLHHTRPCLTHGARTRGPSKSPLEMTLTSMSPRIYLHFFCIFVRRKRGCSGSTQFASTKTMFKSEARR